MERGGEGWFSRGVAIARVGRSVSVFNLENWPVTVHLFELASGRRVEATPRAGDTNMRRRRRRAVRQQTGQPAHESQNNVAHVGMAVLPLPPPPLKLAHQVKVLNTQV